MSLYTFTGVYSYTVSEDNAQSRDRELIQNVSPGSESLPPSKSSAGAYMKMHAYSLTLFLVLLKGLHLDVHVHVDLYTVFESCSCS